MAEYLYWYLCEGGFLKAITLIGTAGQDNISVTKCNNIPIPLPPRPEQEEIVQRVERLINIVARLGRLKEELKTVSEQFTEAAVAAISNSTSTGARNVKPPIVEIVTSMKCGKNAPFGAKDRSMNYSCD